MRRVIFIFSLRTSSVGGAGGGGGGGALPDFFFFFFPVQQTTGGIGHVLSSFLGAGNQYAECEKQQRQIRTDTVYFFHLCNLDFNMYCTRSVFHLEVN